MAKPVGFVSCDNVGAARTVEQLRLVAIELQMWPTKTSLHLSIEVYLAAMKEPVPPDPQIFEPLKKGIGGDRVAQFFGDFSWAARALEAARHAGT